MGVKLIIAIFVVVTAIVFGYLMTLNGPIHEPPTEYRKDDYFGKGAKKVDDAKIGPFTISVPDTVLTDLKDRLKKARIADSIPGTNFEYGFNSNQLRKIIDYWLTKYDWRKQEAELNKLPHFKTQIEGLEIHFIHVKPKDGKKKTPLMLVHGWPGSFIEYVDIVPYLSSNFELVIPSIPGYGFSEGSHKPGLNGWHIGRIFVKLMKRLGHDKFVYHGNDWGSVIGRQMAVAFPESILGYHTTLLIYPMTPKTIMRQIVAEYIGKPSWVYDDPENDYEKLRPIKDFVTFWLEEMGYANIQATKPDTVGVALNNDPTGLAAYILEKFSSWTHRKNIYKPDGGLENSPYGKDRLLNNVMIYWITESITTSVRLYKENLLLAFMSRHVVKVPTGATDAKHELLRTPLVIAREYFTNITLYTTMDGGHFIPMESPKLVADHIKKFATTIGITL